MLAAISNHEDSFHLVSVVIPARNEERLIGDVVEAVRRQAVDGVDIELIVVDDGSTDGTAAIATELGCNVVTAARPGESGNPGAARNHGVAAARGDPIVFLDADCIVAQDWLGHLLEAHRRGATVVGGSLALPPGLPATARGDYYCGWYLVHPRARAGWVPHHPPPNLSVRRTPLLATDGFSGDPPLAYTSEERAWQGALREAGHRIYFEPRAVAFHYNRPGFGNLLKRHYRWGYGSIESKSASGAARYAGLYAHPWLLLLASPLIVLAHTVFILACWARARAYEPLLMLPTVLASRVAYAAGMVVGGLRWLGSARGRLTPTRPRPRWW